MNRFSWPAVSSTSPIPPGIFQASYGPHGIELIRLEVPFNQSIKGTRGVKVTGDPNIPFDKTTFEIDASGCLDIPLEQQGDCESLRRFLVAPRHCDFQVTDFRWSEIRDNTMQDGLLLDFAMPEDLGGSDLVTDSSCQVAFI